MNSRRLTKRIKDGEAKRDQFNARVPVGTRVRVRSLITDPRGTGRETRTRTQAWCLGHGTPVVSVEGQPGGISIECVDVIE